MAADEVVGLRPTLVLPLGVFLDIAAGELAKRANAAFGALLRLWVLTIGDRDPDFGGALAGLGEANDIGGTDRVPAHSAAHRVDAFPAAAIVGADRERKAALLAVPHQEAARLRLQLLQKELGQVALHR